MPPFHQSRPWSRPLGPSQLVRFMPTTAGTWGQTGGMGAWSGGTGEGWLVWADLGNIWENFELTKNSSRPWHSRHYPRRPSRKLPPSIQIMLLFLQFALTFLRFWGTILASLDDWQHGRGWWNHSTNPDRAAWNAPIKSIDKHFYKTIFVI